jgi:type II secretory pathway pseudopilin PulG
VGAKLLAFSVIAIVATFLSSNSQATINSSNKWAEQEANNIIS